MKSIYTILSIIVLFTFVSCDDAPKQQTKKSSKAKSDFEVNAIVQEVIQTSSYTYAFVKEGSDNYWIAFMKMDVKNGQHLFFNKSLEMKDFHSKELNRDFESVFFVQEVSTSGNATTQKEQQLPQQKRQASNKVDLNSIEIEKAKDGYTIAEIYSNKADFAGEKVKVRGKVVKFSPLIMGKNWIHIQDGTESNGNFDLTITTQQNVNTNVVVTFEGIITVNKDFGSGYFYELIMEEAKIVKSVRQ